MPMNWDTVPIVTTDELKDYMSDVSLTADQWEAAEMVLAGVQAQLEDFLHRPVNKVPVTEVLLPDDHGYVRPRVTPVHSVTALTGFTTIPAFSPNFGLYVGRWGEYSVTYEAGIDGPNKPDIKLAIMRVAKREMQNNHDDTLSVKDLDTTDNPQEPVGWTEAEKWALSRYRRRVM